MRTTIAVSKEVKDALDKLKVHRRETYEEVIRRLIEKCKSS
ncbi:MAG: ribbon-helix-helix protein, CopG family [Candidatus Methanomethyliales bacterium]|nr:ribbon-helix-helix protein, CopG family [Candidatus Methanomethylicales archaeon]MBC7113496.1 ribbon-helix-helix protein, CopG family [Candidatus Methanomethylicales archaeon]